MKHNILLILGLLLLTACGSNDDVFVVKGTLNNLGTNSLFAVYENTEGIKLDTIRPIDGKIELRGYAPEYTAIQIYDAAWMPFLRLYLRNGESVELKGDATAKYEIEMKGNKLNRNLWKFICQNNELFSDVEASGVGVTRGAVSTTSYNTARHRLDSLLIDYISHHRNNMMSSILLGDYLLQYHNFALCDSLWMLLDEDAQLPFIATTMTRLHDELTFHNDNDKLPYLRYIDDIDSLRYINTRNSKATLVCLWQSTLPESHLIHRELEQYTRQYNEKQLQVIAISFDTDTAQWHKAVEKDSTDVIDLWSDDVYTGKILSKHNITRMPVYLLGDSIGTILVRTSQLPDKDIDIYIDSLVNIEKYRINTPIFKP